MKSVQKVVSELIQMYRQYSCLWDTSSPLYGNKIERGKAFNRLLEKYREIEGDATVQEVKKKLANIRTNYRKEHKKVLLSRLRGEDPEYEPQLWYYKDMIFLNNVADYGELGRQSQTGSNSSFVKVEQDYGGSSPKAKRRKNPLSKDDDSIEECNFISDNKDTDNDNDSDNYEDNNEDSDSNYDAIDSSNKTENVVLIASEATGSNSKSDNIAQAKAFGTLVSYQMRDLDKSQRMIAEKLISDIIFKAKFKKLTFDSYVSV